MAPFIGAFLSFVLLHEKLTGIYAISLLIMIAGTAVVVADTLIRSHEHEHQHTYTHFTSDARHGHRHPTEELEKTHASHA